MSEIRKGQRVLVPAVASEVGDDYVIVDLAASFYSVADRHAGHLERLSRKDVVVTVLPDTLLPDQRDAWPKWCPYRMTDPQPIQRAVTGLLSVPWVRRRLGELVGELFQHDETRRHAEVIAREIGDEAPTRVECAR